MTVILKELFERYCLTIEEVKPFLSKKYNINNVQDDLVLEDDQAEYLIDTIYGKIENGVDINYSKLTTVENILNSDNDNGEGGDDWSNEEDDEWTDEWGEDFYNEEEDEDIPDCPPKDQLLYTGGHLACPYCGKVGQTYMDGTAYCSNCRRWYCYG